MPIIPIPPVPRVGIKPRHVGANGRVTSGPSMARLASLVNSITARRRKVLYSHFHGANTGSYIYDVAAACRFQFRTSPHSSGVSVVALMSRTSSATVVSSMTWTVGPAGAGVAQSIIYTSGNGAAVSGPNELFTKSQRWLTAGGADLAGDSLFEASLAMSVSNRLVGVVVCETLATTLDTSAGGLPLDVYSIGAPVLDRDLTAMTDRLWSLYRRQGTHHIRSGISQLRQGATWSNALDNAITGWAATAAGHWVWPYRRATLLGTTVDVTFWCYASSDLGTSGQCRFSNSGGVIATITGIGAAGYYSTTGTLSSATTTELIVVEINNTDPVGITSILAHGCYEHTT